MAENTGRNEIYANAVRAGKRTYFFDVKETRKGEYYLTLTESKRRFNKEQGKFFYEKHKLFLYKEDFEKFTSALEDVMEFIKNRQEVVEKTHENRGKSDDSSSGENKTAQDQTPEQDQNLEQDQDSEQDQNPEQDQSKDQDQTQDEDQSSNSYDSSGFSDVNFEDLDNNKNTQE